MLSGEIVSKNNNYYHYYYHVIMCLYMITVSIDTRCNHVSIYDHCIYIHDIIKPQLLGVQSVFCAGQSTVEQWPYATYLTCSMYQNVRRPSFLSTLISLLIPLIDVLFQYIVKVWRIRAFRCQCNAVLRRDFCSSGHGTRKHWKIYNNIWCSSR